MVFTLPLSSSQQNEKDPEGSWVLIFFILQKSNTPAFPAGVFVRYFFLVFVGSGMLIDSNRNTYFKFYLFHLYHLYFLATQSFPGAPYFTAAPSANHEFPSEQFIIAYAGVAAISINLITVNINHFSNGQEQNTLVHATLPISAMFHRD